MIKIAVDEAYAFDMLSILEVKLEKDDNQINLKNFQDFAETIEDQIGVLLEEILASYEYQFLKSYNCTIFNFINELKSENSDITAKDIDDLNYERWKAKNALQEKFFGEKTREVKIGY